MFELWPTINMDFTQKLNAISRLIILLTILGLFMTKSIKVLISGIVTLGVLTYLNYYKASKREGYSNQEINEVIKANFTEPTPENPLMNVMLPEINENPEKNEAAPAFYPAVEEKINASTKKFIAKSFDDPTIDEKLFKDLGDSFTFDQSMRSFNAMPNTQTPNDQKAFAEFCYGSMKSCKEGDEFQCVKNNARYTNF
tara:strand:- start:113 stop:706 length:594 start_codon:yes stop_codon:yes gene_type:complete